MIAIRAARPSELPAVRALLEAADLPGADVTDSAPLRFWVADCEGSLAGVVGLEAAGGAALLRSLAVAPAQRKCGLGRALVAHAETEARRSGAGELLLLTRSAGPFFEGLGYAVLDRAQVPPEIRATAQFRSLCPASAICMVKALRAAEREAKDPRVVNVLFLCTGNSARSILAEVLLNHRGRGRFRAFSAGSRPTGRVNPGALELLSRHGMPTSGLRSKPWDEFAAPGAPGLDLVITVCDAAAGETCPVWPGQPLTAHWGVADPASVPDDAARRRAFEHAFEVLGQRIDALVGLPVETLAPETLRAQARTIGQSVP